MGKRNFWKGGGLLACLLLFSGCALFLVGAAGAAGGYAISKDTIEGILEKRFDRIWDAAREVILSEGFIRREDRARGELEAEVRKSQVKIKVSQISERTLRVRVKARRGYKLVPHPALANELYNKIFQMVK